MSHHHGALCLVFFLLVSLGAAEPARLRVTYGDKSRTYSVEEIGRLPHRETEVKDGHDLRPRRYSGVPVHDLLIQVGAPLGEKLRGAGLALGVIVRCKDKYTLLFSLAEFDEAFTHRTLLLADCEDGQPLPPSAAPFRLIVPGDKRPARSARQVVALEIVSFDPPPAIEP